MDDEIIEVNPNEIINSHNINHTKRSKLKKTKIIGIVLISSLTTGLVGTGLGMYISSIIKKNNDTIIKDETLKPGLPSIDKPSLEEILLNGRVFINNIPTKIELNKKVSLLLGLINCKFDQISYVEWSVNGEKFYSSDQFFNLDVTKVGEYQVSAKCILKADNNKYISSSIYKFEVYDQNLNDQDQNTESPTVPDNKPENPPEEKPENPPNENHNPKPPIESPEKPPVNEENSNQKLRFELKNYINQYDIYTMLNIYNYIDKVDKTLMFDESSIKTKSIWLFNNIIKNIPIFSKDTKITLKIKYNLSNSNKVLAYHITWSVSPNNSFGAVTYYDTFYWSIEENFYGKNKIYHYASGN